MEGYHSSTFGYFEFDSIVHRVSLQGTVGRRLDSLFVNGCPTKTIYPKKNFTGVDSIRLGTLLLWALQDSIIGVVGMVGLSILIHVTIGQAEYEFIQLMLNLTKNETPETLALIEKEVCKLNKFKETRIDLRDALVATVASTMGFGKNQSYGDVLIMIYQSMDLM